MSDPLTPTGRCARCGAELAPALRQCPACGRLVHADTLTRLAAEAEACERDGRAADAVIAWRSALDLLPGDAPQASTIRARVDTLTRATTTPTAAGPMPKWLASLGIVGALLWKFKFLVVLVLTKGKLLLTGLTQSGTVLTMLASMGLYWSIWGWKFAVGFVLQIYVHEMGHVAALVRLGIKASAPMFIPGIGAVVRMDQYPASPREDARVGLAGPIWGLGATLATYALFLVTAEPLFAALTHAGAIINLFNLTPVWQLDGARGMHALSPWARWVIASLVTVAFFVTGEGTLLVVGLASWWSVWRPAPPETDRRALVEFAILVIALSALTQIRVPGLAF